MIFECIYVFERTARKNPFKINVYCAIRIYFHFDFLKWIERTNTKNRLLM